MARIAVADQKKRVRRTTRARVESVRWLTPQMVRVVLGGEGLATLELGEFSDGYVKLAFRPPGASYGPDFDIDQVRQALPRSEWPRVRSFSVRDWDAERELLSVDFVYHGENGVAGPWAAAVELGDSIQICSSGGGYSPDPAADWHLMVGDLCVVPAIAASLSRLPAGAPAFVVVELDGSDEAPALEAAADLLLHWVRRSADAGDDHSLLLDAVRELELPAGRGQAFVHGEAAGVRAVRRHLAAERDLPVEAISASGYWKYRRTDEEWRSDKPEWKRQIERDLEPAAR